MTQTPAGWFPDPEQPGQLRYWDGNAWTEHRAPVQPPSPRPTQYPGPVAAGAGSGAVRPPGIGPDAIAPVTKKRNGLWWKIALGVVAFFFLIGLIGAVADSLSTSHTTTSTASEETAPNTPNMAKPGSSAPKPKASPKPKAKPNPKPKAAVGSKGNPAPRGRAAGNQSAVYQILGVSVTNSLGAFADPPAGRYVVVDLAVLNRKKSTIQVNMNDFLLQVNGVEIEPSAQAIAVDDAFTYDDISPGLTKHGKIVFDVAPTDAGKGVLKAQAYLSFDSAVYLSLR